MKKIDFLPATNIKLLNQIKGNSIADRDFLEVCNSLLGVTIVIIRPPGVKIPSCAAVVVSDYIDSNLYLWCNFFV
jgi:hypothetical protein